MAAVSRRDTKPEMALRRAIHALGRRFRLDVRELPGRPDLVFPRYRVAAFVHGCFWHGHDCPLFVAPRTRTEFWLAKIASNQVRDRRNHLELIDRGWRVATVWECALRGRLSYGIDRTAADVVDFLQSDETVDMHIRDDGAHVGSGYTQSLVTDRPTGR